MDEPSAFEPSNSYTAYHTPPIQDPPPTAGEWRCKKCGHGLDHGMPTGMPSRPYVTDDEGTWHLLCYTDKAYVTVDGIPF